MTPRRFAFTLEHTALAFALMLAHAQGAWAGTATVALTGSAAPGTGSGVSFASLSVPQLSAAGQVAFLAGLVGTGVTGDNDSGIWRDGALIVREGSAASSAGSGVTFSTLSSIQLNAAGQIAFSALLSGTNITPAMNDSSLWLGSQLIAQTGSAAPGAGSGVSFASLGAGKLNSAGQVAYQVQLTGTGINTSNDSGIWRNGTLVASANAPAPGIAGASFASVRLADFNKLGQVAHTAVIKGAGVSASNDEGIWVGNRLVMRRGEVLEGFTVGSVSNAAVTVGRQGEWAFVNTSRDAAGTVKRTLWQDKTLVAQEDELVDVNGVTQSRSPLRPLGFSPQGEVVYEARLLSLQGLGSSPSLWRGQTLIAMDGQTLVGLPGLKMTGPNFVDMATGGQVVWKTNLQGRPGSGVFDGALILGDGRDSVLAARKGDSLAGSTITALFASSGSFNDKAQLAYQATLADGRSGVFLFTPKLHWRSSASGSWEDAASWTLGVNPTDVHDVIVDAANSLRITGPTGAVTLKSVQVGTGAGLVTLQLAGGAIDAADPVVIGPRGVLTGSGSFSGPVVNQGTVQADRLALSAGLRNAGLVRGLAGGPQTGAGLDADLLNQASGRVLVQPGETLQLRGASHRNEGVFEINQGRLEVAGSLLNASGGVIDLNRATAVADGAWTNAAGARLLLSDARLTVSSGLTNTGQVLVTSGDSDVFGRVVNQIGGQILLSGQGSTTFYDAVELQAGSELRTSAGATAVFFGAVAQRSGALLTGTGRKYFEGGLSIGNSPGLGEDAGSVSFGLGSTYLAEIGGMVLGSGYDHYRVAGTLTMGGTLQLVSFAGFTGEAGQQFDLFDWGALQGQFNHIDSSGLQLAAGTTLDVSRLYIDGVISVTAVPEPGSWALMAAGLAGLAGLRRRNAVRKG